MDSHQSRNSALGSSNYLSLQNYQQQQNKVTDSLLRLTPSGSRQKELESNLESLILDRPGYPQTTKIKTTKRKKQPTEKQTKPSTIAQKTKATDRNVTPGQPDVSAIEKTSLRKPEKETDQLRKLSQQRESSAQQKLQNQEVAVTLQENNNNTDLRDQNIDFQLINHPSELPSSSRTVIETPKQFLHPNIYEYKVIPTQISARADERDQEMKSVEPEKRIPQLQIDFDHQFQNMSKPADKNTLQVFESTSELGNSARYQLRPASPDLIASDNQSCLPNIGENNTAEQDLSNQQDELIRTSATAQPVDIQQTGDIYEQLIDGEISEKDGGGVNQLNSYDPNLKSEINLLVLEEIKEEPVSGEDSQLIYNLKRQSAHLDSLPSSNYAQQLAVLIERQTLSQHETVTQSTSNKKVGQIQDVIQINPLIFNSEQFPVQKDKSGSLIEAGAKSVTSNDSKQPIKILVETPSDHQNLVSTPPQI